MINFNPAFGTNAQNQVKGVNCLEKFPLNTVNPDTKSPTDSYEFSNKENSLTKEAKQGILKQAKTTAGGWSALFGIFDTIYYGLRSDKSVAKKYNLDVEKDKSFIKQIKTEQMKSTIPGALFGPLGGIVDWIYNKNSDEKELDVK